MAVAAAGHGAELLNATGADLGGGLDDHHQRLLLGGVGTIEIAAVVEVDLYVLVWWGLLADELPGEAQQQLEAGADSGRQVQDQGVGELHLILRRAGDAAGLGQ
ncbi:MAG: hypothetical protein N838_04095 [Thiohalocapsa sp. PB-PSB1]|nr:MAG: hypothetical protein N838_21560 [Thiohalocapsa sp. PB-PSB1]QQO52675.1 MAG: hypothetical protein N838_04095 [Thiohalocapsa sp. PB-PSB1]